MDSEITTLFNGTGELSGKKFKVVVCVVKDECPYYLTFGLGSVAGVNLLDIDSNKLVMDEIPCEELADMLADEFKNVIEHGAYIDDIEKASSFLRREGLEVGCTNHVVEILVSEKVSLKLSHADVKYYSQEEDEYRADILNL